MNRLTRLVAPAVLCFVGLLNLGLTWWHGAFHTHQLEHAQYVETLRQEVIARASGKYSTRADGDFNVFIHAVSNRPKCWMENAADFGGRVVCPILVFLCALVITMTPRSSPHLPHQLQTT